ncbi:MAG: TaqI-like C-terminal specificity domain-containing protein [Candidatus Margulisbacteria bacterium]|nr:TaqI-like C-terminal specificity domain-containing protein [Candidatus Margulisiibacteriota bacterium]
MPAPKSVIELVERFDRNIEEYKSGKYNETQLRREFIDPFFEALGWDLYNKQGLAEAYKDVIHEDSIKIGTGTKAPDYCFRVGGTRKFFLEAKKPSVYVKEEIPPAYQIRRYAWSSKLPLSILSDFEEFAVYDCRIRPKKNDKAKVARLFYYTYKDYIDHWDEIAAIFSKEAVLKGSFDKFAVSGRRRRGTAEVDDAFLEEIESWRSELAKNLATNNPKLEQRELNFSVQRIIDRIIFLRICEDRGIEDYGRLMALPNGSQIYSHLCEMFQQADARYNSGLFHFKPEPGRPEHPDELTLKLKIDDDVLKDIIKRLYYPDSPYEFSVLPADILGQVYEQFLGKVIRLTDGHRAVVEEKPEVRKAGGIYYTPTYIVEYIVKNTVGKLLEGKTPKQAEKLRILDPACGSGSFLIGAYQYLIDWHRDWYVKDGAKVWATKKSPAIYQDTKGEWKLTTAEKKRILLNNIYGVDIDNQAVEVTKLSLLLKVLEGETEQTINSTLRLFHERALPDLGNNIKCGNSLIGPDFYNNQQTSFLDEEEKYRINVFDWNKEFAEIMKSGGFDTVIGNPPYGANLDSQEKSYLNAVYPFVADFETSQYFLAKSKETANKYGLISFIVPNTLLLNMFAKEFRSFILKYFSLKEIVNLSDVNVFEGATIRTIIPFMQKSREPNSVVRFVILKDNNNAEVINSVDQEALLENDSKWVEALSTPRMNTLQGKISKVSIPLDDILEVSQGLIPYDKYRGHDEETIKNRIWNADYKKDKTYKKELSGGDVKRYSVDWNGRKWISYGEWLAAPRKPKYFKEPRLLFREITDPKYGLLNVAYTDEEYYNNPSIINCILRKNKYSLFYILGIANSKLIAFWHFSFSPKANKGVFPKILVNDVRNLPIRKIKFSDSKDKLYHDDIAKMAEDMLGLNKQLVNVKLSHEKESLQRQIDATDERINQLVYKLYGLTREEIGVVEEGARE